MKADEGRPRRIAILALGRNSKFPNECEYARRRWRLWLHIGCSRGSCRRPAGSDGSLSGKGVPGAGLDDQAGVSLRPSHLQAISLSSIKKWQLWSLDIENARLQVDALDREVYHRAPAERDPRRAQRIWRLKDPSYGLNDAPAVIRKTLDEYLLQEKDALA